MSAETCSCLIPFHNERDRILSVLTVAHQVGGLRPIICIDDGSDDGGASLVRRHFPGVEIVRLDRSQGKTASIRAGMRLVRTEYVCLLDADLRSLVADEIEAALQAIMTDPDIDMVILRRVNAALTSRIIRGDVLFSGERILRARDLVRVLERGLEGYQLEIAINQYIMEHDKRVYWMPSSARNTFKVEKRGWLAGLEREAFMIKNMLAFAGLGTYLKQLWNFARERVPKRSAFLLL